MPNYEHPNGERFISKGMRTGVPADALRPGEYSILQNVRGNTHQELTTRAGHQAKFTAGSQPINAVSSYTTNTSFSQTLRYLAASNGNVYLDDGTSVATGFLNQIPSMLPFRPAQSPQSWMYVSDQKQYLKLSSPDSISGLVTNRNVGIVEPQVAPTPYVANVASGFNLVAPNFPTWTHSGNAGAVTTNVTGRANDTTVAEFDDPAGGMPTYQTDGTIVYQRREALYFPSIPYFTYVNDVFTPIPAGIVISAIQYLSGSTGQCVIVPKIEAPGAAATGGTKADYEASIFAQQVIANLRRGALVQVGSEVCYVWDVEIGPDGTVCFTTSTTSHHTTSDTLTGIPGIQIPGIGLGAGTAFQAGDWTFTVTGSGIGQIQFTGWSTNFFTQFGASFQPDDYLHFSIQASALKNLTEMKILIDVNNGSADFVSNVFFYAVRPSDIQAGVVNTLTQLGVAQLYTQRQLIQQESSLGVASSTQTSPGDSQWSEIVIPLRNFIRIGTDPSRTLNNAQGIQFLFNMNSGGSSNFALSSITIHGGAQVNVGDGAPILYRIRPRSTATGAVGNPSPASRYGVSPVRQVVVLVLPSAVDPQQDVWDVFRIGATVDSYRWVGTGLVGATFTDDFSDEALGTEILEYDNLQPWPTIDFPLNVASGVSVVGTIVTFTIPGTDPHAQTITRYLPGNIIQVGQNAYTLFSRPTVTGSTTLTVTMRLVENGGVVTNGALSIYEPMVAAEPLPFLWGPTAEGGTVFGVGDPFRPGTVYFAKNFNPDSAPDKYNLELSPPSEPLTGGTLRAGESYVASAVRWWALRPSFGGVNQWTARLLPLPEGVGAVSHFAICEDAFVARDGIYDFRGKLLTGRDNIYSLFPHEGVAGTNQVVAGVTVYAPDYTRISQFRLCSANGFLYFDYPDSTNTMRRLVLDIRADAWYSDSGLNLTTHYPVPQQDPNAETLVLAGNTTGHVYVETYGVNDAGTAIVCVVGTRELCHDARAFSWFGDVGLDVLPTNVAALTAQGISLGALIGSPSSFQGSSRLPLGVVDIGGGQTLKSLGLFILWSQNYGGGETSPATLYVWSPSLVPKPETIQGRFTDWFPEPAAGNKFWQGFLLEADTGNQAKTFQIRDADTLSVMGTFTATFNGQSQQAFSFPSPFIAHSIRLEPTGEVPWRFFHIIPIAVPYPEQALEWRTEGTSHGERGYQHIYMGQLAYIAKAAVVLTLVYDQLPSVTITLPATAGGSALDPAKVQFKVPASKFKVVDYQASSGLPFYLFSEDTEFWVGEWGRSSPYRVVRPFGGETGLSALV